MYDPTIGRWISEDPLGFKAGDPDLYRYAENDPTNRIDPNGEFEDGVNVERDLGNDIVDAIGNNTIGLVVGIFVDLNDRNRILRNIPRLDPATLPRPPADWTVVNVNGGHNKRGVVPTCTVMGPNGCGPCVGVILIPPNRSLPTYAYHFGSLDLPLATFIRDFGTRTQRRGNLTGYRAVICGARSSDISSIAQTSGKTLRDVVYGIGEILGLRITGYVPGPGAGVDRNGRVYWTGGANETGAGY
jgi:hypothetical protein